MAAEPHAAPARVTKTASPTPATAQPKAAPKSDQIAQVEKAEAELATRITKNPIYKLVFEGTGTIQQRIEKAVEALLTGIRDTTVADADLDARRNALSEINAHIHSLRRRLGSDVVAELLGAGYADFQSITRQMSGDAKVFMDDLAPLMRLGELLDKYGGGNLIENITRAQAQKAEREQRLDDWRIEHDTRERAAVARARELESAIKSDEIKLESAFFGKAKIQAKIANAQIDLQAAQQKLEEIRAEKPPAELTAPDSNDESQVDEGVLELQDISGSPFKQTMHETQERTQEALARISINFDEVITKLTNSRVGMTQMDRMCSDGIFAISVLAAATKSAMEQAQSVAQKIIEENKDPKLDELDKLERERRSRDILDYVAFLTTFHDDLVLATASLRGSQGVLQNALRVNKQALDASNQHKLTGLANTSDAVAVVFLTILDACNRGASRSLIDGMSLMRRKAQEGTARLTEGSTAMLEMQNEQLAEFIGVTQDIRSSIEQITKNTDDLIRQHSISMAKLKQESDALAEASAHAQQASLEARSGVQPEAPPEDEQPKTEERPMFGLRIPTAH